MAFLFLYMKLTINKLNGCGLSNVVCCEHLPKNTKVRNMVLATEGLPGSSNKSKYIYVIKVSGQMRIDAFKRRLSFSFTSTLHYC